MWLPNSRTKLVSSVSIYLRLAQDNQWTVVLQSCNNIHFGVSTLCCEMTASLLAVKNNSLLPSQSIFNEIKSIHDHDTGFFHEIEAEGKDRSQVWI